MGCSASKQVETTTVGGSNNVKKTSKANAGGAGAAGDGGNDVKTTISNVSSTISTSKPERLYKLLVKAQTAPGTKEDVLKLIANNVGDTQPIETKDELLQKVLIHCQEDPHAVTYQNPTTKSMPLHMAVRLLDFNKTITEELFQVIRTIVAIHPIALTIEDAGGNIPLHYAIAPTTHFKNNNEGNEEKNITTTTTKQLDTTQDIENWKRRTVVVRYLINADWKIAQHYLQRYDVIFESGDATGGCTPLYRVLQTLPDDFNPMGTTVEYASIIQSAYNKMVGVGNSSDGDKPLALLYRRFTRQFDISEKFFAGDNSRPEVITHRRQYKTAAGNTWKIIELLLRPPVVNANNKDETGSNKSDPNAHAAMQWGIVHRAVQVETPPDLLRYVVETNAQDLTRVDKDGNLPLHHAAKSKPPSRRSKTTTTTTEGDNTTTTTNNNNTTISQFPAFYTKYVIDELLYKFPEGASMPDADGNFPLTLAIRSNKQWIGGGIKSLYDAYPEALKQIDLEQHTSLKRALSMTADEQQTQQQDEQEQQQQQTQPTVNENSSEDELNITTLNDPSEMDGVIKDEHHDAIMLVQQSNVDITEVATSMWAHEEDAGVQMLGCLAISRMCNNTIESEKASSDGDEQKKSKGILRIALSAVAAVVNAMKAHPNEMIVQEKACNALKNLANADGQREVSMVASGAIAAIVGAMQAHVGDPNVQDEACSAIASIVINGGSDRATVVASVSGVTAIINAIAAHPTNRYVQISGCNALLALTEFQSSANLPDLPKTQTEPILTAAKENFPNDCTKIADILLSRMS